MTRKKKKKQPGITWFSMKPLLMAIVFFLAIGFFTGSIEKFLEQTGGISETGLIFGFTPLRFYIIMLFLMIVCFAALAGSWKNARDELLEKLD